LPYAPLPFSQQVASKFGLDFASKQKNKQICSFRVLIKKIFLDAAAYLGANPSHY
jgi:hypothetical protein